MVVSFYWRWSKWAARHEAGTPGPAKKEDGGEAFRLKRGGFHEPAPSKNLFLNQPDTLSINPR